MKKILAVLAAVSILFSCACGKQVVDEETTENTVMEYEGDAYEYYSNNSQLVNVVEAQESEDVMTEKEVKAFLEERGFSNHSIVYEYSITGESVEQSEVDENSDEKHPMYQTVYYSAAEESWIIYVINDSIFAMPFDYNAQLESEVQVLIAESDKLTSYDGQSNLFFITIPNETEIIAKPVDVIDAQTLDSLTIEEIDRL